MGKLVEGLKVAVPLWSLLFLGGFLYGRSVSPDLSRRDNLQPYLSKRLTLKTAYAVGEGKPGSSMKTLRLGRLAVFACGPDTYAYDELRDTLRVMPTPHYTPPEDGVRTQPLNDAQIAALASLLGLNVKDAVQPLLQGGNPSRLVLLAGGVLGAGMGYYVGYREVLDCDNGTVQSVLREDKALWKRLLPAKAGSIGVAPAVAPR